MNRKDIPARFRAPISELLALAFDLDTLLRNEGYLVQESDDRQGVEALGQNCAIPAGLWSLKKRVGRIFSSGIAMVN